MLKKICGYIYLALLSVTTFCVVQYMTNTPEAKAMFFADCALTFTKFTPRLSVDPINMKAKVQGFNAYCSGGDYGCDFTTYWQLDHYDIATDEFEMLTFKYGDAASLGCNTQQAVAQQDFDFSWELLIPGEIYNVSFIIFREPADLRQTHPVKSDSEMFLYN